MTWMFKFQIVGTGDSLNLTYRFAAETYVRRSGAWVKDAVQGRRGGAWSDAGPEVYMRRSGAWVDAQGP